MSEAFSLIACESTALIRRMTGASSSLSRGRTAPAGLGEPGEVRLALDALDDLPGFAAAAFVGLAQELVERRLRHALDHQRDAEEAAQLRDGGGLRAFAVNDLGLAVGDAAHQHAVPLREREGRGDRQARSAWAASPRSSGVPRHSGGRSRRVPRPRAAAAAAAVRRRGGRSSGAGGGGGRRRLGRPDERRQHRLRRARHHLDLAVVAVQLHVAQVVVLRVGLDRRLLGRRAARAGG